LEGHSVNFLAIQTHLSCRCLLAVDCLSYIGELEGDQPQLAAINTEAAALLGMIDKEEESLSYRSILRSAYSKESAYEMVQGLTDQQLERLFCFLSALNFGQAKCDELDTRENSIFNRVACELDVDMRSCWKPDHWFLSRRTTSQLQGIIKATGLNRLFSNGARFKKTDLVRMMVNYFCKVGSFKNPKLDQIQARD
jgi:hypothetical protein